MGKHLENKKIINAESSLYCGIKFRSKLEERMYKKLLSLGLFPQYEEETFTLIETFRPTKDYYYEGKAAITKTGKPKSLISWTYTPDFKLEHNGITAYIEAKGYPNDLWPYKRKLFLKLLESKPNAYFFEVKTITGLLKSLNIFYSLANEIRDFTKDTKSGKIPARKRHSNSK